MVTSSNGNIFALLAICAGNSPVTREFPPPPPPPPPHKGQWRGALMFSLLCVWINGRVKNREAGDLRRYHAHYYVIVMQLRFYGLSSFQAGHMKHSLARTPPEVWRRWRPQTWETRGMTSRASRPAKRTVWNAGRKCFSVRSCTLLMPDDAWWRHFFPSFQNHFEHCVSLISIVWITTTWSEARYTSLIEGNSISGGARARFSQIGSH